MNLARFLNKRDPLASCVIPVQIGNQRKAVIYYNGVTGNNYDFSNKSVMIRKMGSTGAAVYHIIGEISKFAKEICILDYMIVITLDGPSGDSKEMAEKTYRIVERYFCSSKRYVKYIIKLGKLSDEKSA